MQTLNFNTNSAITESLTELLESLVNAENQAFELDGNQLKFWSLTPWDNHPEDMVLLPKIIYHLASNFDTDIKDYHVSNAYTEDNRPTLVITLITVHN